MVRVIAQFPGKFAILRGKPLFAELVVTLAANVIRVGSLTFGQSIHRDGQVPNRFHELVLVIEGSTAIDIGRIKLGINSQGVVTVLNSLIILLESDKSMGSIDIGELVALVDFERTVGIIDSLFEIIQGQINRRPEDIGILVIGVEFNRLGQNVNSLVILMVPGQLIAFFDKGLGGLIDVSIDLGTLRRTAEAEKA